MNKTKITDTLNSDAKIYVYMKDTSTQDQTLATVDPSVSSFDAKNIFYCDNANFVADFDAANNTIKWTTHTHDWGAWTSNGDGTHRTAVTSRRKNVPAVQLPVRARQSARPVVENMVISHHMISMFLHGDIRVQTVMHMYARPRVVLQRIPL